jgi:hypothetical protein
VADGAPDWRTTAREGFGSPQWTDNVGRMHLFMDRHPDVVITTPLSNGMGSFRAKWPDGEASDASLGWLMDKLEQRFDGPASDQGG